MINLYIITKQEFTSLYRFGHIPLNLDKIIETKDQNDKDVEANLLNNFMSLPYFVGDEEYLIISFENVLTNNNWLHIEKVNEIIPLTKAAKNSYQMKFDSRLEFKDARYENIIQKVEEAIDIQEMYRGANAFWNLCKVKESYNSFLQDEIIKNVYSKRINGIKSAEFNSDFFTHLLVYDRYEFFPNTDMGFFYDIGEIFAHSKAAPTFKGSGFHTFLEKNKLELSQRTLLEQVDIISNAKEIENFTKQLSSDNLKAYIAAVIFLKFKSDLSERDTIKGSDTGKLIKLFKEEKKYNNELNFAIYLTGLFFGYKKFYDDLYELSNLKIFKKKIEKPVSEETTDPVKKTNSSNTKEINNGNNEENETDQTTVKTEDSEQETRGNKNSKTMKREYTGIKKQKFEQILSILKQENGSFEIKGDYLKQLKKELIPLSEDKKLTKKVDVVNIIREKFKDTITIEQKERKFTVRFKTELDKQLENLKGK